MSEVLSQAQPYIQLEEVMKSSTNHSAKRDDDSKKSKPHYEAITGARNLNGGNPPIRDRHF